jgi:hypothetical protein
VPTIFYPSFSVKVNSILGDHQYGFQRNRSKTGQTQIYSAFIKYFMKKWDYNEAVYQLFKDLKKSYDSVRRESLYNILIEFGIPRKLVIIV